MPKRQIAVVEGLIARGHSGRSAYRMGLLHDEVTEVMQPVRLLGS